MVDLITVSILYLFQLSLFFLYPLSSIMILIALQRKEVIQKYWILLSFLSLAIGAMPFFVHSENTQYLFIIIIHSAVLLRILHLFVLNIAANKWVNFFYVALAMYELTVILKFVNYSTGLINAYDYFIVTTIFEITLGLFFVLFREDNDRIVFQLK